MPDLKGIKSRYMDAVTKPKVDRTLAPIPNPAAQAAWSQAPLRPNQVGAPLPHVPPRGSYLGAASGPMLLRQNIIGRALPEYRGEPIRRQGDGQQVQLRNAELQNVSRTLDYTPSY